MKNKEIKDALKKGEQNQKEGNELKERADACMKEINDSLQKHNCDLICQQSEYYGQLVYLPVVRPKTK